MKNKTKVIAFRVTEREYDAIMLDASFQTLKMADYVRARLFLPGLLDQLDRKTKQLEAKAKRAAKKAEKAAQPAEVPQ